MRRAHSNRAKHYKYATILLLIIFIVSVGFFFLKLWENGRNQFPAFNAETPYLEYEGEEYELKQRVETFLVLGLDKFEDAFENDSYNNNKQADFLMLYVFDNDNKTYSAIHINRDTMAEVNVLGVAGDKIGTTTKQIALAHTYGNGKEVSCRNTTDAVSELLFGTKVDYFMSVTMDAVEQFNDLLGGVEIETLNDFTDIDPALVKGEKVTLNGEQALKYVRSRHDLQDSSNSARMERQRQYLSALRDQALARIEEDPQFIMNSVLELSDYIVSNRTVNQLEQLLNKFSDYEHTETINFNGETKMGQKFLEFYPSQNEIKQTVVDIFYKPKEN